MPFLLLPFLLFILGIQQETPLRADGLIVHHEARERGVAIEFLNAWPDARERVERFLGTAPAAEVSLQIVRSINELRSAVKTSGGAELPRWVAGVAIKNQNQIVVRADLEGSRRDRILGLFIHELTHLAIDRRASELGATGIPRWLHEGLAQIAEGRLLTDSTPNLPMRHAFGALIPLAELDDNFPEGEGASALAYAEAESFVRWLLGHQGIGSPTRLLDEFVGGRPIAEVLSRLTSKDLSALEADWKKSLSLDRSWVLPFLGQSLFPVLLLTLSVVALNRIRRRRREWVDHWERAPEQLGEVSLDATKPLPGRVAGLEVKKDESEPEESSGRGRNDLEKEP